MNKFISVLLVFIFLTFSLDLMAQTSPVSVTPILQASKAWDGSILPGFRSSRPELKVLSFEIQPGAKTPIHLHPENGAGYIVSGELTMYSTADPKGSFADTSNVKKIVLKPGDAWAESVNIWHYGVNNGDKPVKFVVVFASEPETPATISLTSLNP